MKSTTTAILLALAFTAQGTSFNHRMEVRWTFDDGTGHPTAPVFYECVQWQYFGGLSDGPACRDPVTLEWSFPPCPGGYGAVRSFEVVRNQLLGTFDLVRVDCRAEILSSNKFDDGFEP